jgi:hypothetical protein
VLISQSTSIELCPRQRQSTNDKREQNKKDFYEGSSELADYFIEDKNIKFYNKKAVQTEDLLGLQSLKI